MIVPHLCIHVLIYAHTNIFCEFPHVYFMGKKVSALKILTDIDQLAFKLASTVPTLNNNI